MDLILIPGAWLDASSWDQVTPALEAAGHRVHAMTLPGLESVDADRSGIALRWCPHLVVSPCSVTRATPVLVAARGR